MDANQKFNTLIILGIIIFCITPNILYAQRTVKDSILNDSSKRVAKIIRTAKSHGRKLELNHSQRYKFIAENKNANSDLFKPQKTLLQTLLY